MATGSTQPKFEGFTPEQTRTIRGLHLGLGLAAAFAVLAGITRLGILGWQIWQGQWSSLVVLPEALLLIFLGLIYLTGAADARFLSSVKGYEKEHLGNTLASLSMGAKVLLGLAVYVLVVALFQILSWF
jgi:hypothetical protein